MGTDSATAFVGIDVSKDALDTCLLADGQVKAAPYANDPKGHAALAAWAGRHAGPPACTFAWKRAGRTPMPSPFTSRASAGSSASSTRPASSTPAWPGAGPTRPTAPTPS
nr:hypothetical protein [Limnoglobus roseus]